MDLQSAFSVQAANWTASDGIRPLDPTQSQSILKTVQGVNWLCLTVTDTDKARETLEHDFGFHPVPIEDALSDTERPGMYSDDSYVFATVPVIETIDGESCYTHLGLFVCKGTLISVTTLGSKFVSEWFERWKAHPAEVGPTTDRLMQELIDAALDDYFPALDAIQEDVDELEERVYSGAKLDASSAVRLRRKLLEMRRQVTPIRDVVNALLRRDVLLIHDDTRTYFQDVYDHALRVLEGIDLNRDILTSIMDAQLSVQSNKLNEVMRNMTSIATILMILALIPGVYGMNFQYMPELKLHDGYFIALGSMVVVFIGGLVVASKIGWLTVNWPWKKRQM